MISDYHKTGKLYDKLDAYVETIHGLWYLGSSNQFKTQKAYKSYVQDQLGDDCPKKIIIERGE